MAAKGLATAYGTNSVLNKLQNNPMFQKRMMAQENLGMDKRAVSNINQVLGKEVANEQLKMQGLDRAGKEIARRKDSLDFARKSLDYQERSFKQAMSNRDAARNLKATIFEAEQIARDRQFKSSISQANRARNYQNKYLGLEFGLGLVGTGTSIYREAVAKRKHDDYMKDVHELTMSYRREANKWRRD